MAAMRSTLRDYGVSTVCEEARCPNRPECFKRPTAAFMVLGEQCTRSCGFCGVTEASSPLPAPQPDEPARVAHAARRLGLSYVVVTSVTRDDLPDGGAGHFAATIAEIRRVLPGATVEVLIPDFRGDFGALKTVLDAGPDVLNHNVETVPRLYGTVRPQADYARSLRLLQEAQKASTATKSGLMLGLGESIDEVRQTMRDIREAGCDFLTIGQYMRPTARSLPVAEYIEPEVFDTLGDEARATGFLAVASGPLVRSSMHADSMYLSQP